MPARDIYHDTVRNALLKDGWMITNDPLRLRWGLKSLYVDLGVERILGFEKGGRRIAVEVKSFVGQSDVEDLEHALGQFVLYQDVLAEIDPERMLYLAVPEGIRDTVFTEPIGHLMLRNQRLRLLVFSIPAEEVLLWIP